MSVSVRAAPELDAESFRSIAALAYKESGLTLAEEKTSMICSRLRHRLRALGMTDFSAYTALLHSDAGVGERRHLISALTTNVSHFFREDHHFDLLRDVFVRKLPALRAGGQMRIWSAGCSNGQEAVSAAITLCEAAGDIDRLNVRILGTDIDPEVITFARHARYPERLMRGVDAPLLAKYFERTCPSGAEPEYTPRPILRNLIRFNQLNLLAPWPMTRQFDVIFCRNVVIYFDLETQLRLWPRIKSLLSPDGLLFLGHSERIADPATFGFACTGPTTYQPSPP